MDPANHPTSGSPTASLLTIEPDDIDQLHVPSIFKKFKDLINTSLHHALSKLPRKCEGDALSSADYKRVCTLGTCEPAKHSLGIICKVTFDRILFDTEAHSPLPLNFFLRENLHYISDIGSTLLKVKVNPTFSDSPTSAVHILDIEKLMKKFGNNLSMSCSDWNEAAENYFVFQQFRDIEGPNSCYSTWLRKHFEFFSHCEGRMKYYDAWKVLERDMCLDYHSFPEPYSPHVYFLHYMDTCNKFNSKIELNKKVNLIIASSHPRQPSSSTLFSTPSWPFLLNNKKTSFPSCCLLCTKGGHSVVKHHRESKPSTFSDGRPTWAHIHDQDLLTPSRQQICMFYNIHGASHCSHAEGACTHVCSWCGSSVHYAFSYTCCPHPVA